MSLFNVTTPRTGIPTFCACPRDQALGTPEDEVKERVEYLAAQMKDGFEYVSKTIGPDGQ